MKLTLTSLLLCLFLSTEAQINCDTLSSALTNYNNEYPGTTGNLDNMVYVLDSTFGWSHYDSAVSGYVYSDATYWYSQITACALTFPTFINCALADSIMNNFYTAFPQYDSIAPPFLWASYLNQSNAGNGFSYTPQDWMVLLGSCSISYPVPGTLSSYCDSLQAVVNVFDSLNATGFEGFMNFAYGQWSHDSSGVWLPNTLQYWFSQISGCGDSCPHLINCTRADSIMHFFYSTYPGDSMSAPAFAWMAYLNNPAYGAWYQAQDWVTILSCCGISLPVPDTTLYTFCDTLTASMYLYNQQYPSGSNLWTFTGTFNNFLGWQHYDSATNQMINNTDAYWITEIKSCGINCPNIVNCTSVSNLMDSFMSQYPQYDSAAPTITWSTYLNENNGGMDYTRQGQSYSPDQWAALFVCCNITAPLPVALSSHCDTMTAVLSMVTGLGTTNLNTYNLVNTLNQAFGWQHYDSTSAQNINNTLSYWLGQIVACGYTCGQIVSCDSINAAISQLSSYQITPDSSQTYSLPFIEGYLGLRFQNYNYLDPTSWEAILRCCSPPLVNYSDTVLAHCDTTQYIRFAIQYNLPAIDSCYPYWVYNFMVTQLSMGTDSNIYQLCNDLTNCNIRCLPYCSGTLTTSCDSINSVYYMYQRLLAAEQQSGVPAIDPNTLQMVYSVLFSQSLPANQIIAKIAACDTSDCIVVNFPWSQCASVFNTYSGCIPVRVFTTGMNANSGKNYSYAQWCTLFANCGDTCPIVCDSVYSFCDSVREATDLANRVFSVSGGGMDLNSAMSMVFSAYFSGTISATDARNMQIMCSPHCDSVRSLLATVPGIGTAHINLDWIPYLFNNEFDSVHYDSTAGHTVPNTFSYWYTQLEACGDSCRQIVNCDSINALIPSLNSILIDTSISYTYSLPFIEGYIASFYGGNGDRTSWGPILQCCAPPSVNLTDTVLGHCDTSLFLKFYVQANLRSDTCFPHWVYNYFITHSGFSTDTNVYQLCNDLMLCNFRCLPYCEDSVMTSCDSVNSANYVYNVLLAVEYPASDSSLLKGIYSTLYGRSLSLSDITAMQNQCSPACDSFRYATSVNNAVICSGSNATLTATSGVSYLWSTSNTTASINESSAGTYTVTVTASSGCTASASGTVTISSNPSLAADSITVCNGTNGTLTVIGGASYIWSTGDSTASINQPAGTYTVTATNALGCIASASGTINWYPAITAPSAPFSQSVVSDTPYKFTFVNIAAGIGGNQIEWSTSINFSNSQILPSPANISVSVDTGASVYIWMRSRDSVTGCVSYMVMATASVISTVDSIASNSLGSDSTGRGILGGTPETVFRSMLADPNPKVPQIIAVIDSLQNRQKNSKDKSARHEGDFTEQYETWKWFWGPRASGSDGNMNDIIKILNDYGVNQNKYCTNSTIFPSNWSSIGPDDPQQYRGRVNQIWVEPGKPYHIIAGTTGGVWELGNPSNSNWVCITDIPASASLPALNITSLAHDNSGNSVYDISVGTSGMDGYAFGLANRVRGGGWSYDNYLATAYQTASGQPNAQLVIGGAAYDGNGNLYVTCNNMLFKRLASSHSYIATPLLTVGQNIQLGQIAIDPDNQDVIIVIQNSGGTTSLQGEVWLTKNATSSSGPTFNNIGSQVSSGNPCLSTTNATTTVGYDPFINWTIAGPGITLGTNSVTVNPPLYGGSIVYHKLFYDNGNDACYCSTGSGNNGYPSFGITNNEDWELTFDVTITGNADVWVQLASPISSTNPNPDWRGSSSNHPWGSGPTNTFDVTTSSLITSSAIMATGSYKITISAASVNQWYSFLGFVTWGALPGASAQISNVKLVPKRSLQYAVDIPACGGCNKAYFISQESNYFENSNSWGSGANYHDATGNLIEYDFTTGTGSQTRVISAPEGNQMTVKVSKNTSANTNIAYVGNAGWYPGVLYAAQLNLTNPPMNPITSYNGGCGSINTHADIRSIFIYPSGSSAGYDQLYIGTDGGIFKNISESSLDCSGLNWTTLNFSGLSNNLVFGFSNGEEEQEEIMLSAVDDGTLFHSSPTNPVWSHLVTGDGSACAVDPEKNDNEGVSIVNGGWSNYNCNINTPTLNPGAKAIYHHPITNQLLIGTNEVNGYTGSGWNPITSASLSALLVSGEGIVDMWVGDNYTNTTGGQAGDWIYVTTTTGGSWPTYYLYIYNPSGAGSWSKVNYFSNTTHTGPADWFISPPSPSTPFYHPYSVVADPDNPIHVWVGFNGVPSWQLNAVPDGRVLYSDDGGGTWTDKTINNTDPLHPVGLPFFPVNKLAYQRGTDNVVYAATDAGVYVWNKNLNGGTWECFNTNLSLGPQISDMEIVYCENKLKISTWGRGIWETPLPNTPTGQTRTMSIINPTTWSSSMMITQNIDITSSLTISGNGTTINMAPGTQITVEPGALLTVNGATITNGCGQRWKGIYVLGNSSYSQAIGPPNYIQQQGKVVCQNNATIENASIAILAGDGATLDGGIVQVSNSNFLNNNIDIKLLNYQNFNPYNTSQHYPNYSNFAISKFETNQVFSDGSVPTDHIYLHRVDGINIYGCTFDNTLTSVTTSTQGSGIFSSDANFNVTSCGPCYHLHQNCCNPTANTFTNLQYGVKAQKISSSWNYSVDGATFTKCSFGVFSSAVDMAVVTRNTFNMGNLNYNNIVNLAIYFAAGTGYRIEENTINGNGVNLTAITVGTDMYNTGGNNNQIYKNTFTDVNYANLAYGQNRNGSQDPITGQYYGLAYFCNNQSASTYYDMYLEDMGVRQYQGVVNSNSVFQSSAGNSFTSPCTSTISQIDNISSLSIVYGGDNGTNHLPTCTSRTAVFSVSPANTCPSHFSVYPFYNSPVINGTTGIATGKIDPTTKSAVLDFKTNQESTLSSDLSTYRGLLDGGDQAGLLKDISGASSSNATDIAGYLLSASPYLTSDVLHAFINKYSVFGDDLTLQVLSSNAQVVYDQNFVSYLQSMINSTSANWMLGILDSIAGDTINPCQMMEAKLSQEKGDLEFALNLLANDNISPDPNVYIDTIANDSAIITPDWNNHIQWLREIGSEWTDYQIVDNYLQQGNTSQALTELSAIPGRYSFSTNEQTEYNGFNQILTKLCSLYDLGKNELSLSSSDITTVQNIADNGQGCAQARACNIMTLLYNTPYCPPNPPLPSVGGTKRLAVTDKSKSVDPISTVVKIYPNPANQFIQVYFKFPQSNSNSQLEVAALDGRLLYQTSLSDREGLKLINTENWEAGLYICSVRSNKGVILGYQKIAITH